MYYAQKIFLALNTAEILEKDKMWCLTKHCNQYINFTFIQISIYKILQVLNKKF